jgi:pimeloyl-ACP methyl ester carboxylesterase
MDKSYLLAFGRNDYVLHSGSSWDEARARMNRLWEQSAMAREARWEVVEPVVHGAWLASAEAFARARLKAHARQRIECGMLMQAMATWAPVASRRAMTG